MQITIDYIARMANVSKATVSRVINNKADGVGKETRAWDAWMTASIVPELSYN